MRIELVHLLKLEAVKYFLEKLCFMQDKNFPDKGIIMDVDINQCYINHVINHVNMLNERIILPK